MTDEIRNHSPGFVTHSYEVAASVETNQLRAWNVLSSVFPMRNRDEGVVFGVNNQGWSSDAFQIEGRAIEKLVFGRIVIQSGFTQIQ